MSADADAPPRKVAAPAPRSGLGRLGRVVPAPLADRAQRPVLLGWLGVGIAIRLAIAPFAISPDLLAVYWRAHMIAYEGEVFATYLVNMGAHYVHALALRVLEPLMIAPDQLWTDPWFFDDFIPLAPQVVADVAAMPGIHLTLLALKLPYLLAELGAGLVLLGMVASRGPRATKAAWIFWMLSPIAIYAGYVWGRYEAFPLLLVLAALWCAERRHPWWSAVLLGLAVTTRSYPLLLIPLFALVAPVADGLTTGLRAWARQAAYAAIALAPFGLISVSNRLLAGTVGELSQLTELRTGSTFTALVLPLDGFGDVVVFIAVTVLIWGALAGRQWGWWGLGPVRGAELWVWVLPAQLAMFAFAPFGAHWFAWFTPFVALAIARRPAWRGILPLHLGMVLIALAIADLAAGPDTLLGAFLPASAAAGSLPSLREAVLTTGNAEQLASFLRTGFFAAALLTAAPAVLEMIRGPGVAVLPADPRPTAPEGAA